jgi:hypothetical protein
MKSTTRLIDNLASDDFRKAKIDLNHAVKTIMDRRVTKKKKDYIAKLNQK